MNEDILEAVLAIPRFHPDKLIEEIAACCERARNKELTAKDYCVAQACVLDLITPMPRAYAFGVRDGLRKIELSGVPEPLADVVRRILENLLSRVGG